jgi:predicted amidohydrolase
MLCWENWMPLARFVLHAQGEQVHVALWPDVPEFNVLATRSYAFEGRCFVVSAGTRLLGSDLPDDLRDCGAFGPEPVADDRVLLKGGSTIAGPDGRVLATAALEDDLLFADLDLDVIAGEQQIMDVAGHYNRPDLFQLSVNGSPMPQVSFRPGPGERPGAG